MNTTPRCAPAGVTPRSTISSEPLDPDKTRAAFDTLRVRVDEAVGTVKAVSRKADSYSLQLEQTRMACTAAESQARVAVLDTNATTRLLNESLEQLRVLELRIRALESSIPERDVVPMGTEEREV